MITRSGQIESKRQVRTFVPIAFFVQVHYF
jgi:hypothetical protein